MELEEVITVEIDIPHIHEEECEESYAYRCLKNHDCIDKFVHDNILNQHTCDEKCSYVGLLLSFPINGDSKYVYR